MFDWAFTLAGFCTCIVLIFIANWRAAKPRNDLARIRIPWLPVMIAAAFVAFLLVVHMANLAGFETGAGKGMFG